MNSYETECGLEEDDERISLVSLDICFDLFGSYNSKSDHSESKDSESDDYY